MRTHGTLIKWNDDRGFGFISPAQGSGEVFVHISAFPRDGKRPQVNELISYETEVGSNGKLRAIRIMRPGQRQRLQMPRRQNHKESKNRSFGSVLVLLIIAVVGVYGFSRLSDPGAPSVVVPGMLSPSQSSVQHFRCDGRTSCSQMTSCAEARYFLQHCPGTKMDGDGDGKPCEQQWCN
jgi:cold shock CspA family protein